MADLFSTDAENAVIGFLLAEPNETVLGRLRKASFYNPTNQEIFVSVARRWRLGEAITPVGVYEDVRSAGQVVAGSVNGKVIAGTEWIDYLKASAPKSIGEVEEMAGVVSDYATRRIVSMAASRALAVASNPTANAAASMQALSELLDAVRQQASTGDSVVSLAEAFAQLMEDIEREAATPVRLRKPVVRTGFQDIDRALGGGLLVGDKMFLAGVPGTHKSGWTQDVVEINAESGRGSLTILTEMIPEQIAARHASTKSGVNTRKIMSRWLSNDELSALRAIDSAPGLVMTTMGNDIADIATTFWSTKARLKRMGSDLDLLVIDYLQQLYIPGWKNNRTEEINRMLIMLQEFARHAPVIIISGMNKDQDLYSEPSMRSATGSSGIEHFATIFALFWLDNENNVNWKFDKARDTSKLPRGTMIASNSASLRA